MQRIGGMKSGVLDSAAGAEFQVPAFSSGPCSAFLIPRSANSLPLTAIPGLTCFNWMLKLITVTIFERRELMEGRRLKRESRQRRVILEELRKLKTHPDASELYQKVKKRLPKVSLGTVYRNLEFLAEQGEVQVLEGGPGPRRYDGDIDNHYHIRCVKCGRIGDIMSGVKMAGELSYKPVTDYKVLGMKLEFFGVCPECRKKKN